MRIILFLLGIMLAADHFQATAALQTYTGMLNNQYAPTEIVGGGTLQLSGGVGTSISFTFTRGGSDSSTMNNYLVFFLDSTTGGFGGTSSFTDRGTGGRSAISGLNYLDPNRSLLNFAGDFGADYALVIHPDVGAQLWQLGTGEFNRVGAPLLGTFPAYTRSITFQVGRDLLGMSGTDALRFQSTWGAETGYRSLQSFEQLHGVAGFNTISFDYFNVFEVQPVPEMTNLALVIFGGLFVGAQFVPRLRRQVGGDGGMGTC